MERAFNRAFTTGLAATNGTQPKNQVPKSEEADMELADKILLWYSEKDYFSCFDLPQPRMNALDRPVWDVSDKDLSKAFRKTSLKIHPDKNPDPRARDAFDKLNSLYQILRDHSLREELIRTAAEKSKRMEKRSWNPAGMDLDEELEKVSASAKEKRELQKEEADGFASQIAAQLKMKRARAQYKQALESRRGRVASASDSEEETQPNEKQAPKKDDEDIDEEAAAIRSAKMRANAKRKKKKFTM